MARLRQFKNSFLSNLSGLVGDRIVKTDSTSSKLESSDLREDTVAVVTTKEFRAKKLRAAERTLQLGPALGIGAAGGEVIYHDTASGTENHHLAPRKAFSLTQGTQGAFTVGRVVGQFATGVLQPVSTLRSDDVTAQVGVNNDADKVQFLFSAAEDVMVSAIIGRFAVAQTGVRMVIRISNATGVVVYESEPDWTYNDGAGISVNAYAGTAATETTFESGENPLLLLDGSTYHITLESSVGAVVALGDLVGGAFTPYISRTRADVAIDPVVAQGVFRITAGVNLTANDWYSTIYADASAGNIQVRLPNSEGSLAAGMGVTVIKTDNSANSVTVIAANFQLLEGGNANTGHVLTERYQSVHVVSDGVTSPKVAFATPPTDIAFEGDIEGITETIAGIETRLDVIEGVDELDQAGEGAIMAALASLAARLDGLDIPTLSALKSSVASLVAKMDGLSLPSLRGAQSGLASMRAVLDAQARDIERSEQERANITASIAGVEARIAALESIDELDQSSESALYAAIASIGAQVSALRIPLDDGIRLALASLAYKLDALDIPAINGQFAALAALRSEQDAQNRDIETADGERIALAETIAGAEDRISQLEDERPGEDALRASVASLRSEIDGLDIPAGGNSASAAQQAESDRQARRLERGEQDRSNITATLAGHDSQLILGEDERVAIAETIAGIEDEVISHRTVQHFQVPGYTLASATGVTDDVPGSDFTVSPGTYIVIFSGASLIQSSVVGSFVGVDVFLRDVTSSQSLTQYRAGGHDATSFVAAPFCMVWRVIVGITSTFRLRALRGFANAPTATILSGSNTLTVQRVGS